jgi:hypothetical protein
MPNYEVTLEVDPDQVGGRAPISEILRTRGGFRASPSNARTRAVSARAARRRAKRHWTPISATTRSACARTSGGVPTGRRAVTRSLDGGRALGWRPGKRSLSRSVEQKTKPIWLLDQPEERLDIDQGAGLDPAPVGG